MMPNFKRVIHPTQETAPKRVCRIDHTEKVIDLTKDEPLVIDLTGEEDPHVKFEGEEPKCVVCKGPCKGPSVTPHWIFSSRLGRWGLFCDSCVDNEVVA
jgi:hypothetical protein